MTTVAWQRLEGALAFVGATLWLWARAPGWPWWLWPILALLPDLAIVFYLAGSRIGALFYNGAHLYAGGLILGGIGHAFGMDVTVTDLGLIWIAHVGFDRMLGYGLKEVSDFHDTHLARIGR
ncbi:DUF4260 family protein [Frigidibacter sp. RF13]|uniref:DUF4260 family protein n=1 Tax=Frigidibacter sp. RF13 TaxID=2997340 RepID=UPI0022705D4A|nr:DUF4260 family protein [Frigidibacter sp. RF13]MCY1127899.1 DUF4260 family protein [Frigidibacter sp. RF13]